MEAEHPVDRGLTHIALETADPDRSIAFYERYAAMQVVHRRTDDKGGDVAWLSDRTRPFVIVLLKVATVSSALAPWAHLGVACRDRAEVDQLCQQAQAEGVLIGGPEDAGPPVGYWAFLRDPDGHTLELSYGQEIAFTVEQALS
jgi:catechol 2,3-dioxygenase-like lactoylglutathione lyase family enzyme